LLGREIGVTSELTVIRHTQKLVKPITPGEFLAGSQEAGAE
jgi:hypothetical protein